MTIEPTDELILGIETSCDETAAAVSQDGRTILSDVIYSQADMHALYGGVVPEIASRKHIEKISLVAQQALEQAGVGPEEIDAVAATCAPAGTSSWSCRVTRARAASCPGTGTDSCGSTRSATAVPSPWCTVSCSKTATWISRLASRRASPRAETIPGFTSRRAGRAR